MRPFQPMILALTLCLLVGAAAAETRKARFVALAKKTATPTAKVSTLHNLTKPLHIAPAKRTALPRAQMVQPKTAKTVKAKHKVLAALRVGRRPLIVKRAVTPKRPRAVIPREIDEVSRGPKASAAAFASVTLTVGQKDSIYRIIANIPLQPRSVTTERVSPQKINVPSLAKPPVDAIPRRAVAESEPVVGAQLPPTVTLYKMPPRAAETVPKIGAYRYAFVGERVLLVDPVTGIVVAAIKP